MCYIQLNKYGEIFKHLLSSLYWVKLTRFCKLGGVSKWNKATTNTFAGYNFFKKNEIDYQGISDFRFQSPLFTNESAPCIKPLIQSSCLNKDAFPNLTKNMSKPFIYNIKKWSWVESTARFLIYAYPFFNIMHESAKPISDQCSLYYNDL